MFNLVIFPNDSKTLNLITGMDTRNFSSPHSIAAICLLFALVVVFGCLFSLLFMAKTGAGFFFVIFFFLLVRLWAFCRNILLANIMTILFSYFPG